MKKIIAFCQYTGHSVLNSYAMLFFSKNNWLAVLILLVSFFNPYTGLGGLVATVIAVVSAYAIGFSREQVRSGLYTYSALLLGLGMGTFYTMTTGFWILLSLAALVTVLLSAMFIAQLAKNSLPALSLAFIFTFWIVMLSAKEFSAIGISERNIYWLNEMYATGGHSLINFIQRVDAIPMSEWVAGFFRSLSAILFQSNLLAGILLAVGLLLHSRIAFTLMVLGYATAMLFIYLMGGYNGGVNYYNLGTNFMLVATALGGFYIIPSTRSYLWAMITVPVSYLLVISLGKITYTWGLPVFSLPFCITVILFLYCLSLRRTLGKLVLTPIQYYHPEVNLYRYLNGRERLLTQLYRQFSLPFLGEWMVSQGYDGSITHQGDWSKALDFVILDEEMKTYRLPGNALEHFHCFNKPVLCPADGVVTEVIDHIDDNPIGGNNTRQNWGNTIIIKHSEGLYSKLSHLKKQSIRVSKGAFVHRGDVLALCGNSGRSPEPHLHFQVQTTPWVGSKTLAYPLAYFWERKSKQTELRQFTHPEEGSYVSNLPIHPTLVQAFNWQPGMIFTVSAPGFEAEEWEVGVTAYNESFLICRKQNSAAYFSNDGTVFSFTNYYGSKQTLLYGFYQSAYKVIFSAGESLKITDQLPLHLLGLHPVKWLQDFLAPFFIFLRLHFTCRVESGGDVLQQDQLSFHTELSKELGWWASRKQSARVNISNGNISSFTIQQPNQTIEATCSIS